jgi:hypothetical protein
MNPPSDPVVAVAAELRNALGAEVAQSEVCTELLKNLALNDLLKRAAVREAFNANVTRLHEALKAELAKTHPAEVVASSERNDLFREVSDLTRALQKRDAFNLTLAQKTLGFVKGYLSFLSPRLSAYDRRGEQTEVTTTQSSVSGRA